MIVLDTNVLSECIRPAPTPEVLRWLTLVDDADLCTTAPVIAELLLGVQMLPAGRRRDLLAQEVATLLDAFTSRTWAFDEQAAAEYALVVAERRDRGRPISTMNAQIAAIARSREAVVATRDVAGLACTGLVLVDPWTGRSTMGG